MGFMPALNLRWVDCHGHYQAPFDPDCWGWRTQLRPFEVIGYPKGLVKIRFHDLFGPLIGHVDGEHLRRDVVGQEQNPVRTERDRSRRPDLRGADA